MSDDAAMPEEEAAAGVPAWVMTFADLMTLLMCFFVLLLSFSEMDVAKFKQLAGSMNEAFGVQAEIEVKTIPKGTSMVAQEFSPGRPQPTAINEVRQFTVDSNKNTLDFVDPETLKKIQEERTEIEEDAKKIREALTEEILDGEVYVSTTLDKVIIHILEQGSFGSGDDSVKPAFLPVLNRIRDLLSDTSGTIGVSGHTDNVPIHTRRFRSNWELSAARAVSVAHVLLRNTAIEPQRFVISGHADTKPIAPNDANAGRAQNRRVDITLTRRTEDGDKIVEMLSVAEAATTDE